MRNYLPSRINRRLALGSVFLAFAAGGATYVVANPTTAQAVQFNTVAVMGTLHRLDPAAQLVRNFDTININGQFEVHAARLNDMTVDSLRDLLQASSALAAVKSDAKKLSKGDFEALKRVTKMRLRGEVHFKKGEWFVRKLGVADNKLFSQMSDYEKVRMYDLAVEYLPQPDPNATKDWIEAKKVFAQYALSQNPSSVDEFVAHFQFARAEHAYNLKIPTKRKKARELLFAPTFAEGVRKHWSQKYEEVASMSRIFHWGSVAMGNGNDPRVVDLRGKTLLDMADDTLVEQVRQKRAYFDSNHIFAYHSDKHWIEMQRYEHEQFGTQRGGPIVTPSESYLKAAQAVIANPKSVATQVVSQDGGKRIINFELTVTEGNQQIRKKAVVKVDKDGWVTLATYMPIMK